MQFDQLKRRYFITLMGGAATVWPLVAHAQQGERVRHIGVLMSTASDHLESKARLAAFLQRLQELGWVDGRTVRIDVRWPVSDARIRSDAAELAALAPDVILESNVNVCCLFFVYYPMTGFRRKRMTAANESLMQSL